MRKVIAAMVKVADACFTLSVKKASKTKLLYNDCVSVQAEILTV